MHAPAPTHDRESSARDAAESPRHATCQSVLDAIAVLRGDGAAAAPPASSLDEARARALAVIYHAYAGMLRAVARRYVGPDEAEDVVHDMFWRLPTAILRYRDGGFGGWLKQCTVRLALMRLRRERRWHDVAARDQDVADVAADARDVRLVDAGEDLGRALARLPERLRVVVVLRVYHGRTHAEIGARLGISSNASEVRFCRALKRLRRAMCPDRAAASAAPALAQAS